MLKLLPLLVFVLTAQYCFSQNTLTDAGVNKTISENQELEVEFDSGLERIVINLENLSDSESKAYWTTYTGDIGKPESEIGPKFVRTIKLSPRIEDKKENIRTDQKELVLNTNRADKIVIRVEKGEINIQVKPYIKKRQ